MKLNFLKNSIKCINSKPEAFNEQELASSAVKLGINKFPKSFLEVSQAFGEGMFCNFDFTLMHPIQMSNDWIVRGNQEWHGYIGDVIESFSDRELIEREKELEILKSGVVFAWDGVGNWYLWDTAKMYEPDRSEFPIYISDNQLCLRYLCNNMYDFILQMLVNKGLNKILKRKLVEEIFFIGTSD